MAAKETKETKVMNEEVKETAKAPETTTENTEVVTEEKKDNFIMKGLKAYGKALKEHPVKTVAKTVAVPAAFTVGVFTGKAVFGAKPEIIDVVTDVIEDAVPAAAEEIID